MHKIAHTLKRSLTQYEILGIMSERKFQKFSRVGPGDWHILYLLTPVAFVVVL